MNPISKAIQPQWIPPLDPDFCPAALAYQSYQQGTAQAGVPLVIGLERGSGEFSRIELKVFPDGHPRAEENLFQVERLVKFLLWQRGGYKVFIGGPRPVGEYIRQCYSADGPRHFDFQFMGRQVYERPFEVVICQPEEVPTANEVGRALGGHLQGCRIGFDLGASDRKVSAVMDGQVVFSEEVIWEPRKHSDPEYHYREILSALQSAASKLPRVDAIGGSSAGIIIHNRPMVASLFRAVPPERYDEIKSLFQRIGAEMQVPIEVINDGDVTALAGAMSLEDHGILGIAMGSSQAAGFVDPHGHILNWLSELAFAPVDYNPGAPVDEWSGDQGGGALYFSQQCVFRLAPKAAIDIPAGITDAEKLAYVQQKLESGHAGAAQIWQSMGIYLGYALAHYAAFYEMKHVLILGRCTSGRGGDIILDYANRVLKTEFPDLAARLHVELPSEKNRRVGQSIAAASLPENKSPEVSA
jgi:predicted NBD/HSP70 family sugar kinase